MIRVSASSYPIINEIVSQFDRENYEMPPELVAEELNGSIEEKAQQKLSKRIVLLPEVLQGKIYDLAPNISRWILSTGILRKEPTDSETWKAIEASAANRLKRLNVARIPYISSTERLIQHIFNSAIARARPADKLRIRSAIIATSKKEVIIENLLRALIKIEAVLIQTGIALAALSTVLIISVGFWVLFDMGITTLAALAAYRTLYEVLYMLWIFFGIAVASVMSLRPQLIADPIERVFNKVSDLADRLVKRQQAELDNRQIHKASEIWANLLLGSKA